MALTTLTKQPSESRLYDMDFSGLLVDGATIATVVSVVGASFGLISGSEDITITGQMHDGQHTAQARIAGGTAGEKYKITYKVTDTLGNTLEADGILKVKDF